MVNLRAVFTPVLCVIVVFQHLPPSVSQTDGCKDVDCQQGTCEVGIFNTCKCKEGWGNIFDIPYLPCGIPKNCSLDFQCDGAPSGPPTPPPTLQLPNFPAPFNPCTLSVCGLGKCVPLDKPGFLTIPYKCECNPGNANIMNMTSGMCLPLCSVNAGCSQLGFPIGSGSGTPSPPSTIKIPPSAGLYPPAPGPGQRPNAGAGKGSKEITSFLATVTVGAAFWLLL